MELSEPFRSAPMSDWPALMRDPLVSHYAKEGAMVHLRASSKSTRTENRSRAATTSSKLSGRGRNFDILYPTRGLKDAKSYQILNLLSQLMQICIGRIAPGNHAFGIVKRAQSRRRHVQNPQSWQRIGSEPPSKGWE